MLGLLIVQV